MKRELDFDLELKKGSISVKTYFDQIQILLNSAGEK